MTKKSQVWGKRLNSPPDKLNVEFCAGRDVRELPMADQHLLEYDIWTNLAHAKMLNKVGVIEKDELKDIQKGLNDLAATVKSGEFVLDPAKEDVHINTEHYLTNVKGIEAGKKIHSGRSRNDQVSTDMRLYIRDQIIQFSANLARLIDAILEKAEGEVESLMPGFTHYQPAMLTTAGHWMTSWSQALLRDLKALLDTLELMNRSPLGAAASFGTSWPIDREFSAELLGFDEVEENSLDCISNRGEIESRTAGAVAVLLNHMSIISQDMILLNTPYYDMLKIDDRFVTGSSIMPQKQNPDFAEVIRGKAAQIHGSLMSLLGVQKGAMSGYNRDTQVTKYLIMDLFRECIDAPVVLAEVIKSMTFKRDVMLTLCEKGFMNSADVADWLARKFSLSFRDCYDMLSLSVKYSEDAGKLTHEAIEKAIKETGLKIQISKEDVDRLNTPSHMLNEKKHTGAPSPASVKKMIKSQSQKLKQLSDQFAEADKKIQKAKERCFK